MTNPLQPEIDAVMAMLRLAFAAGSDFTGDEARTAVTALRDAAMALGEARERDKWNAIILGLAPDARAVIVAALAVHGARLQIQRRAGKVGLTDD